MHDSLGESFVASTRSLVDVDLLPASLVATRWVNLVLIKINVFSWKLVLDKLPIRLNLYKGGLDVPSLCCLICKNGVKLLNHLFFSCPLALTLLEKKVG